VLIGHLNKREGSKGLYRGLGSIDVVAAARSILQVDREHDLRTVKQIKNNLAPAGENIKFEITKDDGFRWIHHKRSTKELTGTKVDIPKTKHELAANLLKIILQNGEIPASEIRERMKEYEIGDKTLREVKSDLGIKSIRRTKQWYWRMPGTLGEESAGQR